MPDRVVASDPERERARITSRPRRPRRARRRRADGRPVLTGRAMVLGGVMVLLVVLLAAPVHRYLDSRSAVGQAARSLTDDRAELRQLQAQLQRWSDPGFVQQQARHRLQYAMPGDTVYSVAKAGRSDLARSSGQPDRQATGPAWNDRLWDSVRAAGK